jgi:hypothetical protein
MMISSCGRDHHGLSKREDRGPRLGEKRAERKWELAEQSHQDPAPAEATAQAQRGGAPLLSLRAQDGRDLEQSRLGTRLLGGAPDTQQPQGGDCHCQPQAGGRLWVGHARALPRPARAFGDFDALLDPGPQPIPAGLAGLGRQIGQDEPRVSVAASQQASRVQRRRRWGLWKAVPVPRQPGPGWGTTLLNGR